jgi:conjugal transfer pilus assembly protein TraF
MPFFRSFFCAGEFSLKAEKKGNGKFLPLTLTIFFCFIAALFLRSAHAKPFYGKHEEGWFWYQREEKKALKDKVEKDNTGAVIASTPSFQIPTAQQKIKQIQQDFEEATARAILNPTLAHVQDVMTLQRQIIDRSTRFQETWMQASLFEEQHRRAEDNGTPLHRKLLQEQKEKDLQKKLRRLAKETGLFFLFKQSCPHCHAFAPVVKEFAQAYGFEVKAISGDGGTLKEFPDALPDNGMSQKINPKGIYPALFLAHPPTGNVIPAAFGMTTPAQLTDNFSTILKALEGGTFHAD